ncbi:MAG: thioredoxin [Myxococcales bacterium]|nr:thioredoxin [Myxococcales bacterium]
MSQVVNLNEKNFDSFLQENERVLVDFWAEWCRPCKMMSPILDQFAKEQDVIRVAKVNTEESPRLAERYRIMSIPNMKLFVQGEVVENLVGLRQKAQLEKDLAFYLDPKAKMSLSVEEFGLREVPFQGIPTSKAFANEERTLFLLEVEGEGGGKMALSADDKRQIVTFFRPEWEPPLEWVWLNAAGKLTNMEAQMEPGGVSIHFSKKSMAGQLLQEHQETTKGLKTVRMSDCQLAGAMYQVARATMLLNEHTFEQERQQIHQLLGALRHGSFQEK